MNRRLSSIASNEEIFNDSVQPYQEALGKSGFDHQLKFEPPKKKAQKSRRRNITYFNPPFSLSVKTNVGRKFLKLIETAFPPDNPLHKVFNKNTIKISYKCMPNVGQTISRHNAKIHKEDKQEVQSPGCNCMGGVGSCPVGGKCQTDCVIYRAAVTTTSTNKTEFYTGQTSRTFKRRYYEHTGDSKDPGRRIKTTLSKHIWSLKDDNENYDTRWSLIDRATPFNPVSRKCRLCLKEIFYIIFEPENATLNRRSELYSTCRHRLKGLLVNSN